MNMILKQQYFLKNLMFLKNSSFMKNKRIWLIGASEGIGAALAKHLAAEHAQLLLSARNKERLEHLRTSLPGVGHQLIVLDVSSLESIREAWQTVAAFPPDIVIYNAGVYTPMDAQHLDIAAVESMLDINLCGAFRVVCTLLPSYLERNKGHLVLVGSVAGYRGLPSAMGYGASKAGLMHFAENLRADLKRTKIKVQLVSPGFVKTRLTDKNNFQMPCIITPDKAAQYIIQGLRSGVFEIHFPKRFTYLMKLLRLLPNLLYFRLF